MVHQSIAAPILQNADRYGERTAYRLHRDGRWTDTSWAEFGRCIRRVAAGLLREGVAENDRVAIFAGNCPEWSWVDVACSALRTVTVPIHTTSSLEAVAKILGETCPTVAFVGTGAELATLRKVDCPSLRTVVMLRTPEPGTVFLDDFMGEAEAAEAEIRERVGRTTREDVWTLVYTSGTTGVVRGAMLTHGNILSQGESHVARLPELSDRDSSFCLLPLSHVFERAWTAIQFSWGMTHHYCDVSPESILLLAEAKPSVICMVPRVLEKIHRAVQDKFESKPPAVRRLLHKAVGAAIRAWRLREAGQPVPLGLRIHAALADRLVMKKVRDVFGGRLKHAVVGGAALIPEVQEFFLAAGIFVNTGYGLSETTATCACTDLRKSRPGAVGPVLPGVDLRVAEDGEIQVRGPNIMKGYFADPEATRAVFTEEGWFRTGDVGVVEDGVLRITDRLKDLIRTSTGRYVAPQYLEGRLAASPLIDQAAIVGEGRSWIGALLVPDFPRLEELARRLGVAFESHEDLVRRPEIVEHVKHLVDEMLQGVSRHEKVQRFVLLSRPFTIQAGELTPTLKLRRKVIVERYEALLLQVEEAMGFKGATA